MPFIPTEEQINSLYSLLKQMKRERIEVRLIRFINWGDKSDIKNCEIEVLCLEDLDRYKISFDGKIY
ncbi:MAG: hypothetical protein HYY52_01895 [Candidatus Melainabacteria bacterium]|nr:hypothetical protein [Candidatus Melainabacteria bacterium]